MKLVGLSGYARSGKDSAADALVELGWKRIAFADKLREVLYQLNPIAGVIESYDEHLGVSIRQPRVRSIIDRYGWNGYKETQYGPEIRGLLQRLGTEAGRQTLWDSIWVDAAFANLDQDGKYVVTDCRFPNEAAAIRECGGRIVRISRKGVGPANAHPSETSLDDYDFDEYLTNDGTLEEFQELVKKVIT